MQPARTHHFAVPVILAVALVTACSMSRAQSAPTSRERSSSDRTAAAASQRGQQAQQAAVDAGAARRAEVLAAAARRGGTVAAQELRGARRPAPPAAQVDGDTGMVGPPAPAPGSVPAAVPAVPVHAEAGIAPSRSVVLLAPDFQTAALTIDESRRVTVQGTPLSLVLPSDWEPVDLVTPSDLLGVQGLVGPSETYGYMLLQREHLPDIAGGVLAAHIGVFERNARENLGLQQVVQQGSFTVSGRQAVFLEGRAVPPWTPEPLVARLLLVFVADPPAGYMLNVMAADKQFVDLQPVVLEAVRSLRLDGPSAPNIAQTVARPIVPPFGTQQATRTCMYCNGQGGTPCGACSGQGRTRCTSCNGTGKRNGDSNQSLGSCFACFGNMYAMCGYCSGMGRQSCTGCNGTGRVR